MSIQNPSPAAEGAPGSSLFGSVFCVLQKEQNSLSSAEREKQDTIFFSNDSLVIVSLCKHLRVSWQ